MTKQIYFYIMIFCGGVYMVIVTFIISVKFIYWTIKKCNQKKDEPQLLV